MKDFVDIPPLPKDFPEVRHIIKYAIASIIADLLTEVWRELFVKLDI